MQTEEMKTRAGHCQLREDYLSIARTLYKGSIPECRFRTLLDPAA